MITKTIHRVEAARRAVAAGKRLYRITPPPLRRPERALPTLAVAFALWFGALFCGLGVLTTRRLTTAPHQPGPPGPLLYGYFVAVALGLAGAGLALTRRHRAGFALLCSMLVVGQAVTLAAAW